jgi:hypothetical protein
MFGHLKDLPLFDLKVGKYGIVGGCDPKHAAKRMRTRVKSPKSHMKIKEKVISLLNLKDFCIHGLNLDENTIYRMFDPDDEQNVPAMIDCFRNLGEHRDKDFDDFSFPAHHNSNPDRSERIPEMKILFHILHCLDFLLTAKVPLTDHLVNLSKLSHLLFVVYRASGTDFIPAQNYHNLQSIIKTVYKGIVTCIMEDIEEFFVQLVGDDQLENFFCSTRSVYGSSANFDVLQGEERFSAAVMMEHIFCKFPRLKRPSRRLKATKDHWNPRSYLSGLAPGACDPRNEKVAQTWKTGRAEAAVILTRDGVFSDDEVDFDRIAREEPDCTMYKPRGEYVGVTGH